MKRSTFCSALTLLSSILLAGCSLLRTNERLCNHLTAEEMGRRDGALGNARTRVSERADECMKEGTYLNPQAYHQGEKEALQSYYCTPLHAITVGEQGGIYSGVCDRRVEESFLKYYKVGKRITELREKIRTMNSQLEAMQSDAAWTAVAPLQRVTEQQKNALILELKSAKQAALLELNELENRVVLLQKEEAVSNNPPPPAAIRINNPRTVISRDTPSTLNSNTLPDKTMLKTQEPIVPAISSVPYRQSSGDQPPYTQMTILHNSTSPLPPQESKIDPTSPVFAASEYERTSREDVARSGRRFTLPDNDVTKEGTTLLITKDWYPR